MIAPTRRALLAAASAMGVVGLQAARAATHLDQVIVISGDDIGTFDPTKTNSARDLTIINCITNRLVRLSNTKTGEVEPLLATSLVAVEPTRWRATLRQGVRFHNNEPFNAETAKWSLIHYATTALLKIVLDPIDHIDIIDDHTMDIVTKFPTGLMPLMLGTTSEMLEPKWMTSSQYSSAALVGTGCTKLLSWSKGQLVVLQFNEDYWGGKLPIDRLLADGWGDLSGHDLDGPVPPMTRQTGSRTRIYAEQAEREKLTIRQLYEASAAGRWHRVMIGTPAQIADGMQDWLEQDAADGFNVLPPWSIGGFEDFTCWVVPELQRRGVFRTEYEGTTLRENLGVMRPQNRFVARRSAAAS